MANIKHSRTVTINHLIKSRIMIIHKDTSISDTEELSKVMVSFGEHEGDLLECVKMWNPDTYKIGFFSKKYNRFINVTYIILSDKNKYNIIENDGEKEVLALLTKVWLDTFTGKEVGII